MSEFTMDRLRENLEALKMKNTLEILDNYLERAVADKLNIVEVLDHIFSEEAKSKRRRAYEKQIQMSGFPIKKTLDDFGFSFQPSIDGPPGGQDPSGLRPGVGGSTAPFLHLLHQLPPAY